MVAQGGGLVKCVESKMGCSMQRGAHSVPPASGCSLMQSMYAEEPCLTCSASARPHLQGSTFGIPGVLEHTHFLRDLRDVSQRVEQVHGACTSACLIAGQQRRLLCALRALLEKIKIKKKIPPPLPQAEAIRTTLISNIAKAQIPGRSSADRQRLLDIVIVGGGPTGEQQQSGASKHPVSFKHI